MSASDVDTKPLLPLTSTERQCAIARAVLNDEPMRGAASACIWVFRLRGEWSRTPTPAEFAGMLEELRREPDSERDDRRVAALHEIIDGFWAVADAAKYDGPRNATDLAQWFARCHASHVGDRRAVARYRALLERIVRANDDTPDGGVAWDMTAAIADSRKELGL